MKEVDQSRFVPKSSNVSSSPSGGMAWQTTTISRDGRGQSWKWQNLSQGKIAHKLFFCNQSGPQFVLSGLAVEEKWLWPALLLPESLLMFCIWQMWENYLSFIFFTQTWKLTKGEWNSIAFKCFLLHGALISKRKNIILPIILLPLIFLLEISIFNCQRHHLSSW